MNWIKRGLIFTASGQNGWMMSHAQVPCALVLDDRIRVYFASRPTDGMSRTTYIDLDLEDPTRVLALNPSPVLDVGEVGMFDEHGTIPNHVFTHEGLTYLYYVGWSRRQSIPYSNWTGLAVSTDDGATFKRAFAGPVLDRTRDEPHSATGFSCVEHDGTWYGWYATGTAWLLVNGRWEHTYQLRSCRSKNLVDWTDRDQHIFASRLLNESSTRPTVIAIDGRWHMWFCYRGTRDFRDGEDSYRIGYAWSTDLEHWAREDDNAGLAPSSNGWDSTMTAYPCVVKVQDRLLMFYSGNGFGRSGFGYAELDTELS